MTEELKELPSVTIIMDYAENYARTYVYGTANERHSSRQQLQQAIEVVVHKRIEAQVEAEVLKDKLARLGVETRRKYNSVLQQALDALDYAEDYDVGNPEVSQAIKDLLGQP